MLDDVIGQQAAREFVKQARAAGTAAYIEAQPGRGACDRRDPKLMRSTDDLLGHRIGDAGSVRHFNNVLGAFRPAPSVVGASPFGSFRDRVAQQQRH
ncbi:MAG TPA: hypothetical protein PK954_05995, partial [Anaerolineales bacterium]|nr:hypothetical protein [Anaerolineales bacterium]